MSPIIEYITVFHEQHVNGQMFTYIVFASKEITKDEYEDLARTRSRDALNYRGNDDTLDGSMLE